MGRTNQVLLLGVAVAAIGVAATAIRLSGGWGSILWIPICLVGGAGHMVLQIRMLRTDTGSSGGTRLGVLSSAMFVLGFLLQVDEGDGPRWIIGLAVLAGEVGAAPLPAWWPGWFNLAAFVPLLVTWWLLVRETSRGAATIHAG